MNKTLALHFEKDFLMAAIEPLVGRFQFITKRGENKFPFSFFIDYISNKIDYSFDYKVDYQKQEETREDYSNKKYVGAFMDRITQNGDTYKWYGFDTDIINLLLEILEEIRKPYFFILNSKFDAKLDDKEPIDVKISYSSNIQPPTIKVINEFMAKHNFKTIDQNETFAELLVQQFLRKNKITLTNKKLAVIETLGDNLNMSLLSIYNEYDRELNLTETYPDFGIDPRIQVIAQKIVDDVNKQAGLLTDDAARKKEYKRHYAVAEQLAATIENSKRPYLTVNTSFATAPTLQFSTTIAIEEIERLTTFQIRQISRFFEDFFLPKKSLSVSNIDLILLIGNTLNSELIKTEFSRFGLAKLHFLPSTDIELALMALLYIPQAQATPQTVEQATLESSSAQSTQPQATDYQKVDFVNLATLKTGQQVKLNNNDPAPGKGDSTKEFKYLGNMKFLVIDSTRTLKSGDIVTASAPVWVPGIQVDLMVERNGQSLGPYRTRRVVAIWVK